MTNNHGSDSASITLLQARGVLITAGSVFRLRTEDATSQGDYGRRKYPRSGKWYANGAYAEDSIAYLLARQKDPHPIIAIELIGRNDTMLTQMFSRAISERITLEAESSYTQLGVAQDFYIERITHIFEPLSLPRTVWELSPVIDVLGGDSPFILDDGSGNVGSDLDGADVLVY